MHSQLFWGVYLYALPWLRNNQKPLTTWQDESTAYFPWDEITSQTYFVWHDCFARFKCARLQVPMDWQGDSPEADKSFEIAVIKLEATVQVTDPTYGGPIIMNPGGPGESGVDGMLTAGHYLRTILSAEPGTSPDIAKNFDIISFDPRGVSNTRPLVTCFPNHQAQTAWYNIEDTYGWLDFSNISFDNRWARGRAMAEGCSTRMAKLGFGKHLSSAAVARDIVELAERHGEWREAEARRIAHSISVDSSEVLERTRYKRGKEMIQYWGFSYGSLLGATLASMFPERIQRAALDGVIDFPDYMAGGMSTNLVDTDRLLVKLAQHCFEGGPSNCVLYNRDGPESISRAIDRILADFKEAPISIPGTATMGPLHVSLNDLRNHIRNALYAPLTQWLETVKILDDLSRRNGTSLALWKAVTSDSFNSSPTEQCLEDGAYSPACFKIQGYVGQIPYRGLGTRCSDAHPGKRRNSDKEEYGVYVQELMRQSSVMGANWAANMIPCTAWQAEAHWRFAGAFRAKSLSPMLFISNTIDPVTPLRNAFEMAVGFDEAGVLQQNSEGHCSYAGVSMCTGKAIREYFQSGRLPGVAGGIESWKGVGKICEPDRQPFDGYTRDSYVPLPKGETDEALWTAIIGINRAWN